MPIKNLDDSLFEDSKPKPKPKIAKSISIEAGPEVYDEFSQIMNEIPSDVMDKIKDLSNQIMGKLGDMNGINSSIDGNENIQSFAFPIGTFKEEDLNKMFSGFKNMDFKSIGLKNPILNNFILATSRYEFKGKKIDDDLLKKIEELTQEQNKRLDENKE